MFLLGLALGFILCFVIRIKVEMDKNVQSANNTNDGECGDKISKNSGNHCVIDNNLLSDVHSVRLVSLGKRISKATH